ncbi:M16 family metallopeptidase [Ochrovirga pacifica]|uniref:M16 family metallopeptidase n=1 Tax=Ochrovirga pacifica TaxID=1042376 RepID=UPI0002558798|nr:M16 family metallopeptidase [Ochrovirga pacifica]
MRIILSFLLLLSTFTGVSQKLVQDTVLVKKQLPNGLTYYIYPTNRVKGQAYFRLFVKAGSLQETANQRGVAHFLEHMAFNGTKHFKSNELIDFLETKGSKFGHDLNAHTSFEETIYKLKIPTKEPAVIDTTLTVMSDWVHGMLLDSLEIEKERGVVLSEWLSKQSPSNQKGQYFLQTLLNNSLYSKRTVIGDTTSLKNFKRSQLQAFYQKWYDPSLMAVAVAGDVDAKEIEQKIKQKFAAIPTQRPSPILGTIVNYAKDSLVIYHDKTTKKTELNLIQLRNPMRNVNTAQAYEQYLMRIVINKLIAARFAQLSFLENNYTDARINLSNFLNSKGVLLASFSFKPEKALQAIADFNKHYAQIVQHGFTSFEIKKITKSMLSAFEAKVKENKPVPASGMMSQMYADFFNGNSIISVSDEYELMKKCFSKLTVQKIASHIKNQQTGSPFRYLLTTGDEDLDKLPSKTKLLAAIQTRKQLKVAPFENNFEVPKKLLSRSIQAGTIKKIKKISAIDAKEIYLDNGMKVIYKKTAKSKESVLLAGFKKGGLYALDSTDYMSAQYAAPTVAISGYGDFTRDALSYYLAGNSAKVQFLIDKTRVGFFGSSKIKDLKTLFELYYLKATQPKVDSLAYKKLKDLSIAKISEDPLTAKEVFQEKLKYLVRGKDYTTQKLTKATLRNNLSKQKLIPIYKDFFAQAEGFVLTVISDQDLEVLLPYIEKYLGGIPKGNSKIAYLYQPKDLVKQSKRLVANGEESSKAFYTVIHQQRKKEKNIPVQEINNQILENVLKLELNKRLREELGVVYGVRVAISATQHPRPLSRQSISLVCKPADVEVIQTEIDNIIQQIAEGTLDISAHLKKTQVNLVSKFNRQKQKNSFWTKSIRDYYFNQYKNWNFVTDYPKWVANTTVKDIQKITQTYFFKSPKIEAILYPKTNNR